MYIFISKRKYKNIKPRKTKNIFYLYISISKSQKDFLFHKIFPKRHKKFEK